ncbi:MAG: DUF4097 family beta strand repeat-containing protein [Phycisphaerales bacterium]
MKLHKLVVQVFILIAAMLSIGGCVISAGDWSRAHFERTIELQHAMADGSTLSVATASGSIGIEGQAVSEARVVATIRGQAPTEEEARELAEATEIRFEPAGDRLTIKADTPRTGGSRSVSISYDIVVPQQTSIECGSASGSVEATNLQGSVKATTASGSVTCEAIRGGSVHMSTASGSVRLSDASDLGSCELRSSSGRARAEQVQADRIQISSASGSVELRDARAREIDMRGSSGSVDGSKIDCSRLSAESASGRATVEFSPSAPADVTASVSSVSGSVTVVAPSGFAGRVEMSTTSGSVDCDLPLTVQGRMSPRHISGTVGQGTGSLTLRATSGSVRIR